MESSRIVEIYNRNGKNIYEGRSGSGYLITDNHILTARHIIANEDQTTKLGSKYDLRLFGDFEFNKPFEWLDEGCYLVWDDLKLDLAVLKLEVNKPSFIDKNSSIVSFGCLSFDGKYEGEGIGFPVVQKINGNQNPEQLFGIISFISGAMEGRLRLQVLSPVPESPKEWLGISGTSLFVNKLLVGVVVETGKSFGEKLLWAIPVSQLKDNKEFTQIISSNNKLQWFNIEDSNSSQKNLLRFYINEKRFENLKKDLIDKNWKEADEKTLNIMLQEMNKQNRRFLTKEDIRNFPCNYLLCIDELWRVYSDNKFGLSIQKNIFYFLADSLDSESVDDLWEIFGRKVGWKVNYQWIPYSKLNFDISAKDGHLPVHLPKPQGNNISEVFYELLKKIDMCSNN